MGNAGAGFFIHTENLDENSIVYSFGVGDDISFDLTLINEFDCNVYAFDPTPKTIQLFKNKTPDSKFHFYEFGIFNKDGIINFFLPRNPDYVSCATYNRWNYPVTNDRVIDVPVKTLSNILTELGHLKIDLLKIDIEGTEYLIIDDIIGLNVPVTQIAIEFHHRFRGMGVKKTNIAIRKLREHGYKLIAVSDSFEEFTFLKM